MPKKKRRSFVVSAETYLRLKRLKRDEGINICDSIEFLAKAHLSTLEEWQRQKKDFRMLMHSAIDSLEENLHRYVNNLEL